MRGRWLDETDPWFRESRRAAAIAAPGGAASRSGSGSGSASGAKAPRERPAWIGVGWGLGVIMFVGALVFGIATTNDKIFGALLVVPVLVALASMIARYIAKLDDDPTLVAILVGGAVFKLVGSGVKYMVSFGVYNGLDANTYDLAAQDGAKVYRGFELYDGWGKLSGTAFVRMINGLVYTVSPMSRIAGCLVFAFLAYIGTLLFWRAFKIAMPHLDDRAYLFWLLLLPSLLYWPSSIGKEAFLTLCIGAASYGVANLLHQSILRGAFTLVPGFMGVIQVRPHLGLVIFGGLAVATLLRKATRPVASVILAGVVVVVGMFAVSRAASFFGLSTFSYDSISETLVDANERTEQGGSAFSPVSFGSNPPLAAVTVLYRPLPIESGSVLELFTSVESFVLFMLAFSRRQELWAAVKSARTHPYTVYAIVSIFLFIVVFSVIGNFAILARQRTLIMPLYLSLMMLPKPAGAPTRTRTAIGEVPVGLDGERGRGGWIGG